MDSELLVEILDGLARDRDAGRPSGPRLLRACADLVDVTGAGIMLMVDDEHRGTLGGSDHAMRVVEDLQFSLGDGPCVESYRTGLPVSEPNLSDPEVVRWPGFAAQAVEVGIKAIFGFPLRIGEISIGALDLYSDEPGALRPSQVADALVMAELVAHAVMEIQSGAEPGSLAPELAESTNLRTVVHQATGMVSVQLDIPIADALIRLRAYAFAENLTLDDVALAIVDRGLRIIDPPSEAAP